MALILRNTKGSPLTFTEGDNNLVYLENLALSGSNLNNYLPLTGGTITGDLTVQGTASINVIQYVSQSSLNIGTNIITVNTTSPSVRFGGLAVQDSGSAGTGRTGSLLWDSQNDVWIYSNPSGSAYDSAMVMMGPTNASGLGNEVGITTNRLSKGGGSHHITSSQISDDGTTVSIPGKLVVTGSITGSLFGSSSYALTASYALNGGSGGTSFPYTGSAIISGSLTITGSTRSTLGFTGSLQGTSSWATTSVTSSYPISVIGTTLYSTSPAGGVGLHISNSIALGNGAGTVATNASSSIFIGYQAGYAATRAHISNFLGYNAGQDAADAYWSNFIGYGVGAQAKFANASNFIGQSAGSGAVSASISNFIGYNAGVSAINANNSNFIGQNAGYQATSASYSTLLGYNVGNNIDGGTSGIKSNNIIIGTNVTLPNGAKDSINLGGIIFATGSYSTIAGNPYSGSQFGTGKVGINKVSPAYTLDVSGSGNYSNGLTISGSLTVSGSTVSTFKSGLTVTGSTFSVINGDVIFNTIYRYGYIQLGHQTPTSGDNLAFIQPTYGNLFIGNNIKYEELNGGWRYSGPGNHAGTMLQMEPSVGQFSFTTAPGGYSGSLATLTERLNINQTAVTIGNGGTTDLIVTGSVYLPSLTNTTQTNVVSIDTTTGQLYYQNTIPSASYAEVANTASYAVTASYAMNGGGSSTFLKSKTPSNATSSIADYDSIFNPSNLLVQDTSVFYVDSTSYYYVLGDLINSGSIVVDGTIKVGGTLYNIGTITGTGIII
jgi:hypothetical protein